MSCFGILRDGQEMSRYFFHMDVTLVDSSILQGGEWPSVPWYPDTPVTGVVTRDLSWFIEICHLKRLHLAHHIRLQKTSDIFPRWGAYVEYPLPTEWGTCAMAASIS